MKNCQKKTTEVERQTEPTGAEIPTATEATVNLYFFTEDRIKSQKYIFKFGLSLPSIPVEVVGKRLKIVERRPMMAMVILEI